MDIFILSMNWNCYVINSRFRQKLKYCEKKVLQIKLLFVQIYRRTKVRLLLRTTDEKTLQNARFLMRAILKKLKFFEA